MSGEVYRLIRGSGMGGFLCPPGHPNLEYEVRGASSARKLMSDPHTMISVESAADDEAVPAEIRRQAAELLENAKLVRSERWERNVYGYFRNTYSPDGTDRNLGRSLTVGMKWYVDKGSEYESLNRSDEVLRADDPRVVPESHMGYLLVKRYFPDAEPRLDLIADAQGGYGQKPCLKCGTALQYEARVDGFAEPITCHMACPKGGGHEVEPLPAA